MSLFSLSVSAQVDSVEPSSQEGSMFVVEEMPVFPGGQEALYRYVAENVAYPTEAVDKNIQGNVVISFIVERDGSISDATVIRSIHPLLDKAALEVVGSMPRWKPGKQKGKTVRVRFNLPVQFKLL